MLINLSMMGFAPIADVYLPYLYGKLIYAVEKNTSTMPILTWIITMLVIVQIGNFMKDYLDRTIIPAFETITRDIIIARILDKFEGNYTELNTGEVLSKIMKTPGIIKEWFKIFNDWLIPFLFVLISSVVYLFYVDVSLALLLITFISILVYVFWNFPPKCTPVSLTSYNAYNSLSEQFDEIFRNLSSVYGSNQKEAERQEMRTLSDHFAKQYSKMINCTMFYKSLSVPLLPIFLVLFVIRSIWLVKHKALSSSSFSSIFMVAISLIGNASWILVLMRPRAYDLGAMLSVNEFLSMEKPVNVAQTSSVPQSHLPQDHVKFVDVSFARGGHVIFDHLDLTFERYQKTLIYGDIGSGKSTLLKLIMRFYKPDSGEIYLDDTPLSAMTPKNIRTRVGYVPQDPILFNRPLIDNVLYGNEVTDRQETIDLIKSLNIYDEDAIEKPVGKNGSNLSGGQRQLVWCLRVLLRPNTEIILMDEPTSSMDVPTKHMLVKLLDTFGASKTILLVSHDEFMKQYATRFIRLQQ